MVHHVHQVVLDCDSCAKVHGIRYRHQKTVRLFPAEVPLESITMDLLGPSPKTQNGQPARIGNNLSLL